MTISPELAAESVLADPAQAPGAAGGRTAFARYLGVKVLSALISFLVTLVIGFVLFNLIPSDPVRTITRGRPVSAAQLAQLNKEFGVGEPL